jgi:ubiquinone/menaquinone biosynthesis C-methylase UbiE/uncharacterized protein YbaR (Trm112 family)
MKRESRLLEFIVCPFCAAPLKQTFVLRRDRQDRIEYGLLSCSGCSFEYPIVAGVLILFAPDETVDVKAETSDRSLLSGPRVRDLVWLIRTNQPIIALSLLLNPSQPDEQWFFSLDFPKGTGQVGAPTAPDAGNPRRERRLPRLAERVLRRYALPRVRRRLARLLMADADNLTAFQAMDLYYRRYSRSESYNYFAYRFGQPRHLAALSLAAMLTEAPGALLDLACGTGHVTHFLSSVRPDQVVIGIDREFFRLWIAQRYMAPDAHFVCTPADRALPVRDQAFHGVFFSDAFHYFLHKSTAVREMQRVLMADGIIVLARFGNAAVEPREGYELQADGYARLFPELTSVLLGEEALVRAYLDRRRPDLHVGAPVPDLAAQKWLSLVVSKNADVFAGERRFSAWPHALGELHLNPIYRVAAVEATGDIDLQFRFPSEWYRFENQGYPAYAPERCRVRASVVRALERGERPPEVEELIAQFVVIGTPHRYC